MAKISIIASFRNEEETLDLFISEIKKAFRDKKSNSDYEIIFVDDNSSDNSLKILMNHAKKNKKIKIIKMKKRYGHSNSIQAGLDNINKKNYSAIIDCDLQDPPKLISLYFNSKNKTETIHFVRKKREDGFFQKIYSFIAYKILSFISGGKIYINSGYFKINPPKVTARLKKDKEYYPYWNYLITKYSDKNKKIFYTRSKRKKGLSKFNIFSINPWLTFFGGAYHFKFKYIIFLLVNVFLFENLKNIINLKYFNLFINFGLFLISINLVCFLIYLSIKYKRSKIKCRYKLINF